MKEKDLYEPIQGWLQTLLENYYPSKRIRTFITSEVSLAKFIQSKGWMDKFPGYMTYECKVDVLGLIEGNRKADFILIEVKLKPLSLTNIAQLIGFTRVIKPLHSLIISPKWLSSPMKTLFDIYRRFEILTFGKNQSIRICKWDTEKKDIDYNFIYPPGSIL